MRGVGIGAGIVALTLIGYPVQDVSTLFIADAPRPVQRDIAGWRHSLMLHNPFNFIQFALRHRRIRNQGGPYRLQVKRLVTELDIVIH
ncbi:Uncharacterised protein [Salmonella enterica subsp. enterica serovar Bovismorbificans]|uniref:Uncharacterized protein n=1 Tax=Salmonella enterica subsp. enterica serovar Bovismorbificans TaxID=58097 RepID=A0A655CQS2_SALET|nr:Uncharacterised protein [Salmonella enterica subsp. enterica serovar Bovismorbificans]CPR68904.1 Uncharacterised protein [Salmonella enterica subsp. enterica serovar Bovismorbificans]